jgi:hypothetical protein
MFKVNVMCLLSAVAIGACGCADEPSADEGASTVTSELVTANVYIDSGAKAATGSWLADQDYPAKTTASTTIDHANTIDLSGVSNPAPQVVYQTARTGTVTYTIPGFTAGSSNKIRLHFAETYWTAAGKREFNVSINGTTVLTNFDVFRTAQQSAKGAHGQNRAVIEEFTENASSAGAYAIAFTSVLDQALISGIEIDLGASCVAGAKCTPTNVCALGTISCATGTPVCVAGGANTSANGSTCGTNEVCDNGTCGACVSGASCTPTNVCALGTISCATGVPVCVAGGANTSKNGASCGTNEVCDNGTCGTCTAGASCTPSNPCHTGTISCATGSAVCTDTGNNVADGTSCGGANVCQTGQCMCHATTANVPGPAAYYPMDVDMTDVDHGLNGTALNLQLTQGVLGNAFFFNGALDGANNSGVGAESFAYLGFGSSQALAGARTICTWVGEYAPASGPGMTIFADELSPTQFDHLGVQSSAPPAGTTCGAANEVFMVDGTNGCQPSGLTVNPADWNYVCYAYDGSSHATFFVNGQSSTLTINPLTVPVWNGNIYMGNAQEIDPNVLQGSYSGLLDEVVVWSSYVPVSAMNYMYNGGLGCRAP